jgi:hypothetical protein
VRDRDKVCPVHLERNLAADKSDTSNKFQKKAAPVAKGVIPVIPVFVEIAFPRKESIDKREK